jgi:hypothetical protein
VLAPSSSWRRKIIPARPAEDSADFHCCKTGIQHAANTEKANKNPGLGERRYAWAELLKRVFSVDALKCARCGGKMRILCAIHSSDAIQKILDCLGIPSRPPPISPAAM